MGDVFDSVDYACYAPFPSARARGDARFSGALPHLLLQGLEQGRIGVARRDLHALVTRMGEGATATGTDRSA